MKSSFRCLALAALLAMPLLPGAAMAQEANGGVYASLRGAYAIPIDSDVSEKAAGSTFSSSLEAKSGFAFMAALGYSVAENLSVEIELGYRSFGFSRFKGLTVSGGSPIAGALPIEGSVGTLSVMANGIFFGRLWQVRPYVGLGIGVARHTGKFDAQKFGSDDNAIDYPGASDTAFAVAYQVMAGIGYPLSDVAEIQVGYRYFATGRARFDTTQATYATHNFEAGVLFRF